MNVRIFQVRAMKCMYAQTRPRFILSSEGVFGGMEFEPMLTPREKSPLSENVPRGGSNPRRCGQRAQTLPTERSVLLNSFLTITGQFSAIAGTLLYGFGSCERHSELTEEMYIPLVHVNVILNLQKRCTSLLVHVNVILNLQKRCTSLWFM